MKKLLLISSGVALTTALSALISQPSNNVEIVQVEHLKNDLKQTAAIINRTDLLYSPVPETLMPATRYYSKRGMTPKEYGQLYGHGNSKAKVNKLRLSHKAKLRRK